MLRQRLVRVQWWSGSDFSWKWIRCSSNILFSRFWFQYVIGITNCAPTGIWRNFITRTPPTGSRPVEIRWATRVLGGCVRWKPIWRMRAWRAWRLPGRWPDEAEGVPSQCGCGDALLRCMLPYLTYLIVCGAEETKWNHIAMSTHCYQENPYIQLTSLSIRG